MTLALTTEQKKVWIETQERKNLVEFDLTVRHTEAVVTLAEILA